MRRRICIPLAVTFAADPFAACPAAVVTRGAKRGENCRVPPGVDVVRPDFFLKKNYRGVQWKVLPVNQEMSGYVRPDGRTKKTKF
jgi:hypothetical protein